MLVLTTSSLCLHSHLIRRLCAGAFIGHLFVEAAAKAETAEHPFEREWYRALVTALS